MKLPLPRKFLLPVGGLVVLGMGLAVYLTLQSGTSQTRPFSDQELAARSTALSEQFDETNRPQPAVYVPLKIAEHVRLAVGGLGLANESQDWQLGDLVTADLSDAPGLQLVERQSLDAVLRELHLSLYGFVRAKEAVRVGKLLQVDWFLLGAEAQINGTNSLVVRLVDARTGVMRDAGVIYGGRPPVELAADLAAFVRQSRQNAAQAKARVYLAVGAFEDLSVNNRRADFPKQLRSYLTAAYQGSEITLLEREYVETLLQEMHLDQAGLTDASVTNAPPPMQSAFWMISGQYQSYETTNLLVEVNLEVRRFFGTAKQVTLHGQPGEAFCHQIKQAMDNIFEQNKLAVVPTRYGEIRGQLSNGKDMLNLEMGYWDLSSVPYEGDIDAVEKRRRQRNVAEAIRAFETVLLLDPDNREAKIYLAHCYRREGVNRAEEARNFYRDILEAQTQDRWTKVAEMGLPDSFYWTDPEEKLQWFQQAAEQTTNPTAKEFYNRQIIACRSNAIIESGDGPAARELAETRLFEAITNTFDLMQHGSGSSARAFGIDDFVGSYGTNRSAAEVRLVELYPRMKTQFPELAPQLLEFAVSYLTDTNTPLLAELEKSLDWEIAHPHEVYQGKYCREESPIFYWCMKKKLYSLAVKAMERKRRVDEKEFEDCDNVALGYALMGAQRWQEALEIFESYSNQPVMMPSDGPWGDGWAVVLSSRQQALCREKMGLPVMHDPREFDLGKPILCLHTPSTFAADSEGLWIGIGGQLLRLDFDLKTNQVIELPMNTSQRITVIYPSATSVWVGTDGAGLIEFNKKSHQCRHFSITDGLMMNRIANLSLTADTLWIGYGCKNGILGRNWGEPGNGGLGQMNIASQRFVSYSPSMAEGLEALKSTSGNMIVEAGDRPTRRAIQGLAVGPSDQVWFLTGDPLRCYQQSKNTWKENPTIQGRCLASDSEHLFVGQGNISSKSQPGPLGVNILNFQDGKWHSLSGTTGLPAGSVNTMTPNGKQLWLGGIGYVALVDPAQDKVLNFAYATGRAVDCIQIAGGYVWAQFDRHLYRAPLSSLP